MLEPNFWSEALLFGLALASDTTHNPCICSHQCYNIKGVVAAASALPREMSTKDNQAHIQQVYTSPVSLQRRKFMSSDLNMQTYVPDLALASNSRDEPQQQLSVHKALVQNMMLHVRVPGLKLPPVTSSQEL